MTDKDLDRLGIIQRVHDHTLLQRKAARLIVLTVRQVLRRYLEHGTASVVSERRGRPGNNRIPDDLSCAALHLIRQHYPDFGPALATEKLLERHGIPVSVETVLNWMISDGL
ncbi:MAG: helix-turn-helix domain-containing protein [Bacteroides graminisolvens]|nr:helix-turn-helix domain-containing protein [Bacteroides graminisolvens]